jgi:hypothetical protein
VREACRFNYQAESSQARGKHTASQILYSGYGHVLVQALDLAVQSVLGDGGEMVREIQRCTQRAGVGGHFIVLLYLLLYLLSCA